MPSSNVKKLTDTFSSFGEAYETFANFVGNNAEDLSIPNMVRYFLTANQQPVFGIDTDDLIPAKTHYFPETRWVSEFLEKHGFFQYDDDQFIALNNKNQPMGILRVNSGRLTNLALKGCLSKDLYDALLVAIERNVKVDTTIEKSNKHAYLEVVQQKTPFGTSMGLEEKTIQHTGHTHNAFYPYLNGGIDALIEDFIQSDETVLILMGEPGTGKSTAVSSAAINLNLLPIYAKKTEVITNPEFISNIFKFSDDYMEKAVQTEASSRAALYKESVIFSQMANTLRLPQVDIGEEKKKPKFPIVIVEDGDLLLKPRSMGNTMMSELLNETDGVGSTVTRKLVITTNITDMALIEPALCRDGRHYLGQPLHFRLLDPMEAVEARAAAGLPGFDEIPAGPISLATALRKPRKKIYMENGEVVVATPRARMN